LFSVSICLAPKSPGPDRSRTRGNSNESYFLMIIGRMNSLSS
jgi:hypothetical protein